MVTIHDYLVPCWRLRKLRRGQYHSRFLALTSHWLCRSWSQWAINTQTKQLSFIDRIDHFVPHLKWPVTPRVPTTATGKTQLSSLQREYARATPYPYLRLKNFADEDGKFLRGVRWTTSTVLGLTRALILT